MKLPSCNPNESRPTGQVVLDFLPSSGRGAEKCIADEFVKQMANAEQANPAKCNCQV